MKLIFAAVALSCVVSIADHYRSAFVALTGYSGAESSGEPSVAKYKMQYREPG